MHKPLFHFILLLSIVAFFLGPQAHADCAFASIFSSRAVLQRDCPLPIWGTAHPSSTVRISLDDTTLETQATAQGTWRVTFPAQTEPGSGHTLTLSDATDAEPIVLSDIAIGEVWLCAGDDAMQHNFWNGVHNKDEELLDSEYSDLRLFRVQSAQAFRPAPDVKGKWISSERNAIIPQSACAFFFGRALYQNLGVPIGLIDVSRSGTLAETWLSLQRFARIPGREKAASQRLKTIRDWEDSGALLFESKLAQWDASYDGSDPFAEAPTQPWDPAFSETDWTPVPVPSSFEDAFDSPQFDGVIWFRQSFELSPEQAAAAATLHLGPIDDEETTWLNGTKLGEAKRHNIKRAYPIPAGTLRAGTNTLTVRAVDTGGFGGFMGRPDDLSLSFANALPAIPLAGTWRARGNRIPKGPRPTNPTSDPNAPGYCFNGMIAPLFPLAIRGALWYHGAANAPDAKRYPELVHAIAEEWRANFTSPTTPFPFLLAEVGAFEHNHREPFETSWAELRWAQSSLGHSLPNSGSICTLDLGHTWNPWLTHKRALGDRLALLALARAYNDSSIDPLGPYPISASRQGDSIVISFSHAYILETSDDKPPAGFQLAGDDGKFVWIRNTEILGESVTLSIPEGMTPTRVRHAWDHNPTRNLIGSDGIPCSSFELPIQPQP